MGIPLIYRLEVGKGPKAEWPWFLRLAKKMPGYRVTREEGLELHVIETQSIANLEGLYEIIREWRGWAFSVDGVPATRRELTELVARRREKLKLPKVPDAAHVDPVDGSFRKTAAKMAARARAEDLKAMGITRDDYERALLQKLRAQRAGRGPDPELGF